MVQDMSLNALWRGGGIGDCFGGTAGSVEEKKRRCTFLGMIAANG